MIYTGVGWRKAPDTYINIAERVANHLALKGWTLRSGHAEGMDWAFEHPAATVDPQLVEIYLPTKTFRNHTNIKGVDYILPEHINQELWLKAQDIARKIHPSNFRNCTLFTKCAHTRNVFELLGKTLDKPSKFMIYYADEVDDEPVGGTRTAVKLAEEYGIKLFNLRDPDVVNRLYKMMEN